MEALAKKLQQLFVVRRDTHRRTAEYIGGPDDDRIADSSGEGDGILERRNFVPLGLFDIQLIQQAGKFVAIFGAVDRRRRCPEDAYAAFP